MRQALSIEFIKEILRYYDIGLLLYPPKQVIGDVDLNYKVTTKKGIYLLKYVQQETELPQFIFLGELHKKLIAKGVPVPNIYESKHRTYIVKSCLLYEFIEGATKKRWGREELTSLAGNVAKMHNALEHILPPHLVKNKVDDYINAENVVYCRQYILPEVLKMDISEKTKEELIITLVLLEDNLQQYDKLSKHIIHGDLNEANALFKNKENVGIIDITLKHEALVFDLGIVLYWWCFPWWTKKFNFKNVKLMLRAYERKRKLSEFEKKLLPFLILRRSLLVLSIPIIRYLKHQLTFEEMKMQLSKNSVRNQEIRKSIHILTGIL